MVAQGIATRARIERLIVSTGLVGISQTAARKKLGIGKNAMAIHCRALAMAGKIEKSSDNGWTTRWGAPGIREVYTAEKRARKTNPKRWQDLKDAALFANHWTEQQPIHRLVPAEQAQPIRPTGPASVWELAA